MKHPVASPLTTLVQTLNDGIAVYKSAIAKWNTMTVKSYSAS